VSGDRRLLARASAARQLIAEDPDIDRLLLLSYVLWPTVRLAELPPRSRPPVTAVEVMTIRALAAQGLSHRAIGERVGRPRPTVSDILRREQEHHLPALDSAA
jgi:Homeodomain-like domain